LVSIGGTIERRLDHEGYQHMNRQLGGGTQLKRIGSLGSCL
jgi:hypothetical protein